MGRTPPRTSSIDSAISSVSGGGRHSSNSSHDAQLASDLPDIANIIRAAGSPEAAIHNLLKENRTLTAQSEKIWRIIDKQRAMVLGLNKDLERATKDRDRYRRKLKEALVQTSIPSPVDSNQGPPSDTGSITSAPSKPMEAPKSDHVEALVSASLREPQHVSQQEEPPVSPMNVALAPYPITPTKPEFQAPSLSNMVQAEDKMPSPTKHAFQQYDADATESAATHQKAPESPRDLPYNASLPPSRSAPKGPPPSAPPPRAPPPTTAPVWTPPPIDSTDTVKAFPSPPRKGPPAPLNLGQQSTSSHLRQAGAEEDTDSDYDDILEVDEIPAFQDRGRRKTREEDDRVREIAAAQEAELRSLSRKSSTTQEAPQIPLPASPRLTVPISPPDAQSRQFAPKEAKAGSLVGMLSSANSDASGSLKSPGLPLSPRPTNKISSTSTSPLHSPPLSPRLNGFAATVPLSPRPPRQQIPMPPGTPVSMTSPKTSQAPLKLIPPTPLVINKGDSANATPISPADSRSALSPPAQNEIYKGLVTEEYPDLLLPPNALPSIEVNVASSRLKPSRASMLFPKAHEEDPVFTLAIFARSNGKQLWRVEKDTSSLVELDRTLKKANMFTAEPPEKSLFSGHSPVKLDARRLALKAYFDDILDTQMDIQSALMICKYLSTNAIAPKPDDASPIVDLLGDSSTKSSDTKPVRHGYLTKKGKNFGGWKSHFFVLDSPVFKYYESPGGPHLGVIKLHGAKIGKQNMSMDSSSPSRSEPEVPDKQARHAFLILEPKKRDVSTMVRHVLCAESDEERDAWVEALMQWVKTLGPLDDEETHAHAEGGNATVVKSHSAPLLGNELLGVSYESTKPGSLPLGSHQSGTPSPPTDGHDRDPFAYLQHIKNISGPKKGHIIQDAGAWGNRQNLAPISAEEKIRQKKRSFFGFGPKAKVVPETHETSSDTSLTQMAYEQHGPIRPQFGCPLAEAVRYNHPADVNVELPAVVYRCIEYLQAKGASGEEGIFRLSGSNVVIRQLRERFNTEGDVNLVTDDQYYDIHAVASLLKQYLRELPSNILTRELHLEFLATTELGSAEEKISALNNLVYRLPTANFELLRYLSAFLITIINQSDLNKMNVRNVGIVFSPTLNIPAPVFALFLQKYEWIFGREPGAQSPIVEVTVSAPALSNDEVRSPRKQKFQDLPTPNHGQQSFPQSQHQHPPARQPPAFPQPQYYQPSRLTAAYDTGYSAALEEPRSMFTTSGHVQDQHPRGQHPTHAGPSYEQFSSGSYSGLSAPTTKSKRRESSMFGMGLGFGGGGGNNGIGGAKRNPARAKNDIRKSTSYPLL